MSENTAPPVHVAFCITELEVGGAERCLVELATRLDRARFSTSVVSLGPPPPDNRAALAERLDAAGVPVRYFDARGIASGPRVLSQLRRHWRATRPDVVQTFLFHANVIGPIAASRAGVPKTVTGLRVAEPHRRWRRPIERSAGRLADRHVAVSEGVARFARERIALPAEKIVVIPNGISIPAEPIVPADLSRLGVPPGRRALAFIGRLDEQKGIEWLIEQTPVVIKRLPEHDLLVVGTGPLAERLRRRVTQLGVSDRVHFCGWRDDVPAILAACELLVFPSQWEGMSNVVLEAMAAARPIVAFEIEGMADALGDQLSEQAVSSSDGDGFVQRLITIAESRSLQMNFGLANRRRAEICFSIGRTIALYERLYLEVIGERSSTNRNLD